MDTAIQRLSAETDEDTEPVEIEISELEEREEFSPTCCGAMCSCGP